MNTKSVIMSQKTAVSFFAFYKIFFAETGLGGYLPPPLFAPLPGLGLKLIENFRSGL